MDNEIKEAVCIEAVSSGRYEPEIVLVADSDAGKLETGLVLDAHVHIRLTLQKNVNSIPDLHHKHRHSHTDHH